MTERVGVTTVEHVPPKRTTAVRPKKKAPSPATPIAYNPISAPSTLDTVLLGNTDGTGMVRSPGIAKLMKGGSPRRWNYVPGYGLSWGFQYFIGFSLSEFTIHLEFSTDTQIAEYQAGWAKLLDRVDTGPRPHAYSFYYPTLSVPPINITALVVLDVLPLTQLDETGLWGVDIECRAWKKPKAEISKPIADKKPKAQDEWDVLQTQLNSRISELSK